MCVTPEWNIQNVKNFQFFIVKLILWFFFELCCNGVSKVSSMYCVQIIHKNSNNMHFKYYIAFCLNSVLVESISNITKTKSSSLFFTELPTSDLIYIFLVHVLLKQCVIHIFKWQRLITFKTLKNTIARVNAHRERSFARRL